MDPFSHLLVTRLLAPGVPLSSGVLPDLPWYTFYPIWLLSSPERRCAAQQGDWPMPSEWIKHAHWASHSLVALALCWGLSLVIRWPSRQALLGWSLHILLDLPTHTRDRMAPRLLWPFSDWAIDGFSWADWVIQLTLGKGRKRSGASPTTIGDRNTA